MQSKILAIDLDGTLLTKLKKITSKNLDAITNYMNLGGTPVIVTGRSTVSAFGYFHQIEKHANKKLRYLACFNGAYIYDQKLNKSYKNFINESLCRDILSIVKREKLTAWFYTEKSRQIGSVAVYGYRFPVINKLFKNLNIKKLNEKSDISSYKINVMSFSKAKIASVLEKLKKQFGNVLTFSLSSKHLIEINNKKINKGYVVDFLKKEFKVNKKDIAFMGDSFNDVPGFQQVRNSFAIKPKNKDVIQYAAHYIDHKRNAVADVINQYILNDANDIKLVATDLDGTLLENYTKEVSKLAANKVSECVDKKNIYFSIATGRNVDDITMIINKIGIRNKNRCFAIANNGSVIYEFKSGNYLYKETIPSELSKLVFTHIKKLNESNKYGHVGCYVHRILDVERIRNGLNTQLMGYELSFVQERLASFSKNFTKNNWYPKDFTEIDKNFDFKNICKFVIYADSPENNIKIANYFINKTKLDLTFTTSSKTNVEINAKYVSKGNAVKFLANYLNINIFNVMTLGDEENDLSMLKITPNSFTLTTSKQIVKDAANNVIKSEPSILVSDAISQKILRK